MQFTVFMYAHIFLNVEYIHTAIYVYIERDMLLYIPCYSRCLIYIKITDSTRGPWHIKKKVDLVAQCLGNSHYICKSYDDNV